ncbi:MAG: glutamine--fructose-6-phosphate transaminase (isomerizing) [Nitrospirota bacterium]
MCGIVGYIGTNNVVPLLIEGLRRLEYRGYDSAGIAFLQSGRLSVKRAVGKLANLEASLQGNAYQAKIGIGHTRWATHGRPSEENAHPHTAGGIAVVHNGIIENYLELKEALQKRGAAFTSETDTEVIVHLIHQETLQGHGFREAARRALRQLRGAYAICAVSEQEPDVLIAARHGCPLVLGISPDGVMAASDIPPLLAHTRQMLFLEDEEMAVLTPAKGQPVEVTDLEGRQKTRAIVTVDWSLAMAEKGGFKHFMLKEIHEQPRALTDTIRGRLSLATGEVTLPEIGLTPEQAGRLSRLTLLACGTSWHAGLVGRYMIEELARLPVSVEIGSEYRYRNPIIGQGDLIVAISQSGETADTLAGLREAKKKGATTLAICNVVGSTLAREADGVIYTHAGPEIGVASTKAFTAQVAALLLLGLWLGQANGRLSPDVRKSVAEALIRLPQTLEVILRQDESIAALARRFAAFTHMLYLGRGVLYPIALEGALKLKEISYIHAEGYPAGEMKHGPIALIDASMPVVVLMPKDRVYEKILSNMMEVKARDGIVIALVTEGDTALASRVDEVIALPEVHPLLLPILYVAPLQLLAYHIAVIRGCDVDQPRNLAKSVTVE